jgi:hypothetical protein
LATFHYIWTLITAGYYDTSALMVSQNELVVAVERTVSHFQGFINIVTFLIVAPELEKAWNSSILARYVVRSAASKEALRSSRSVSKGHRERLRHGLCNGIQHLRV